MLVPGGAADKNGGHFLTQGANGLARNTGPYLFDPSRVKPLASAKRVLSENISSVDA